MPRSMSRTPFFFVLLVLLLSPVSLYSQRTGKSIIISGKVTDEKGRPLPGAAIFIDTEKTGKVTNQDGIYKVKVKPEAREIIVFTLFNGSAKEVIDGRPAIDFVLKGSSALPGPGTASNNNEKPGVGQNKNQMTGQGKTGNTLDISDSKVPVYQDIYDMIRGRVPGVEVSGKSIRIRGSNSLNVSTEPLFVLDGVIVRTIDQVSPDNVKSIEILKGPDATEYGTRGSNGVIIIKTKTGKE
jgi:TonB-dependent SusC/RagA subfamily outer membrane receptor